MPRIRAQVTSDYPKLCSYFVILVLVDQRDNFLLQSEFLLVLSHTPISFHFSNDDNYKQNWVHDVVS